jgi:hypothetical protein
MINYFKNPSILLLFLFLVCPIYAQPPAGDQWIERAFTYANYYWNCRNPDYGDYESDCAHFASQIANAGCTGMCEYNNTDVPDWNQGDCPWYMWLNHTWPDSCDFIPGDCDNSGYPGRPEDYNYLKNYIINNVGTSHLECGLPRFPRDQWEPFPIALDCNADCLIDYGDILAYNFILSTPYLDDLWPTVEPCPYWNVD